MLDTKFSGTADFGTKVTKFNTFCSRIYSTSRYLCLGDDCAVMPCLCAFVAKLLIVAEKFH